MNFKITILLLIALLSVSISPIIAKMLVNVPAVSISFWRMFIGSLALWILSIFFYQGKFQDKSNFHRTILSGILLGIHFVLFFQAIKLTYIANATFLGTLAPLFTLIFEIVFLKRKFKIQFIIGLIIAFSGAILILSKDFNISTEFTYGNIMAVLCSIVLALSFIIAEKVRQVENTIVYTRTLYLSAAITLLFIAFFQNAELVYFTYTDYYGLIILGLVPTLIGHNSFYYAVKYISPTIVSAFPIGEPIIASILAYFIFSEIIGLDIIFGGLLTFSGLIFLSIQNFSKKHEKNLFKKT